MNHASRRQFLKSSAMAACSAGFAASRSVEELAATTRNQGIVAPPPSRPTMKKGLLLDMVPKYLRLAERFKIVRDAGFEVVQAPTTPDERIAEEIKRAADDANIRIDSVMNLNHSKYPLSSSDPAVVEKTLEGMRTSLHNAKLWGSHAVLLVPAVVNAQTSYRDAWTRSQREIRKLLPLAAELKVAIAIEDVWNKFLLSPLEMAKYIAEFQSPWVKAWFDVGNVLLYGYPQDWIRTLGLSIVDVHLKDIKLKQDGFAVVNLGEGDVDWAEVRQAFADIAYSGSVIVELPGGDESYLRDVSQRVDRLVLARP